MQPTKQALQLFRVATVTAMGRTMPMVTTVSGGVLRNTLQRSPGAGEATTIGDMAFLFVVSGIFDILLLELKSEGINKSFMIMNTIEERIVYFLQCVQDHSTK